MRFVESEKLLACVHCGLCLAACPTYVETGEEVHSPRGRIHLMRALEEGRLAPTAAAVGALDLCLGCRACETACPSGVEYGKLIEAARPYIEPFRPARSRWARWALARVLTAPTLGALAFSPLRVTGGRPWVRRLARHKSLRMLRPWLALAAAAPRGRSAGALPRVLEPAGRPRGTAVLLTGCAPATLFAHTQYAAVALLVHAGVRVVVPRAQPCCGALALHLGAAERARAVATEAARTLAAVEPDWVVTVTAGCGALLREYDDLLPGDVRAARVARQARDALDLLAELGLPAPSRPLPQTIAIHDPCHLAHGQGVRAPVRQLLATIPGVRLVELDEADWCCGSAGTYNLTERAMAARLLTRKIDRIVASGAGVIAAANPGCLLQIRAGVIGRGLDVSIEHPLDLLATAHGLGAPA